MGKQAISLGATNSLELTYGHRPMVQTELDEHFGRADFPTGTQAVVAIMPYEGNVITIYMN